MRPTTARPTTITWREASLESIKGNHQDLQSHSGESPKEFSNVRKIAEVDVHELRLLTRDIGLSLIEED